MRTREQIVTALEICSLLLLAACGNSSGSRSLTPSPTAGVPTNTAAPTATTTQIPRDTDTPNATPTPTLEPTTTPDRQLDISICAPDAGPFSTNIGNPFYPLPVGTKWILRGEEEDDEGSLVQIRVEITSLDETELVAGANTRVIEEREWEDDELIEVSRNFFAMNPDGDICFFGEDVDIFEDGEIASHDGAWRAGEDGNLPGILIPANPMVGQSFQQEVAPGIAEDQAVQVGVGEKVEVPLGTFSDTIRYEESSPLDTGTSEKVYARGVGLLVDDDLKRVSAVEIAFDDAKIIIEENSTDGDAGIQIFLDGEGWDELDIFDPNGDTIVDVTAEASVGQQGITELFFESAEPSFEEQPLEELFDLFPEGEYRFTGTTTEGKELTGTATFTHALPDGPVILTPDENVVDPNNVIVSWKPVADPPGSEIVEYQVVVEQDEPVRVFSVNVPATVTSVTVPPEFFEAEMEYKVEVLAIEASGNQTITESPPFETREEGNHRGN